MSPPIAINDLGRLAIGGVPLETVVRSPVQRLVFAALAVADSRGGVDGQRLLDDVWPGVRSEPRRLWDAVHRLRNTLASHGIDLGIVNTGGSYRFDRRVALDSDRFSSLLAEARAHIDRDPDQAKERVDRALDLWRGEPYGGLDISGLLPGLVADLEEQYRWATKARIETTMTIEGPDAVVGDLEALTSDHPYDEGLAELLAGALLRCGRRVDGLRWLRRFRARLADDLGLDVGRQLERLEAELLAGQLTPEDLTSDYEIATVRTWRNSFIGREVESEHLTTLIDQHRLVTVIGAGGVGKTRLVAEVIRSRPTDAQVVFVDLAVTTDPATIDRVVAAALGSIDEVSRSMLRQLLRRKPHLVILDNCEHLADAVAAFVADILTETATTRIVATSRSPLRVSSERLFRLGALGVDTTSGPSESADLLCQRSGLDPADLQAADRRLVDEIVNRLDGIPLALELAAGRLTTLGPAGLIAGLDDRFELLTTGDRDSPPRHRSLEATVTWSTDLLDPLCHRVLARCASFAGSFSMDDAIAICADGETTGGAVRRAVADLIDANLVERQQSERPYRLLETIRHHGRALEETKDLPLRHAEHFVARATELAERSYGADERGVIDELLSQADDYRAAIQLLRSSSDWELLSELVWGLTTTALSMRGTWLEPVVLVADLVSEHPDPAPPRWPSLLAVVGSTLHRRDLLELSAEVTATAIRLAPDSFLAHLHAGVALAPSDPAGARQHATTALENSDPDRPEELLHSLWGLANVYRVIADHPKAWEVSERLIAESERFGTQRGEAIGRLQIAFLAPWGSEIGRESAKAGFELGLLTRTTVAERIGATIHLRHLLAGDLDEAAAALHLYLRRPTIQTPYGPRLLAAACAFFAAAGDRAFATDLGRTLGQNQLKDFTEHPAIEPLLAEMPSYVDPMTIDPPSFEALTAEVLHRLGLGA